MITLATEPLATGLKFEQDKMWIFLADGRQLGVPLAYFPRLLNASAFERNNYVLSGSGTGLHWDSIDEDISVPSLLAGIGDRTRKASPAGSAKVKQCR